MAAAQRTGCKKRNDIEDILNRLETNLKTKNLPAPECDEMLEQLQVHSRSIDDLDPLLDRRGISLLGSYGFDSTSPNTCRIALRCLCNTLFQVVPMRQIFVDENYPKKAVSRMKSTDPDDEFLSARLLLLSSYETNLNFVPYFEQDSIAGIINTNISHYAKEGLLPSTNPTSACNESLNLLSNLLAQYPHHAHRFFESLLPILKMLNKVTIPSPPLGPPVSQLVNCLVFLPFEDKSNPATECHLFPSFDSNTNVNKLIEILDLAVRTYSDDVLNTCGSPLVRLLIRIAEASPSKPKSHLRARLLPSDQSRERVLGTGDSLPDMLLKFCTSPAAPHLQQLVPALLFELSDRNPKRFTQNVGYGYAAGYLFSRGVQLSPEDWGAGDSRNTIGRFECNPITGQRRDMELKHDLPKMTDEEKEREAERLFVLFERLKRTGVDVENPVAQAVQSGCLNELDETVGDGISDG